MYYCPGALVTAVIIIAVRKHTKEVESHKEEADSHTEEVESHTEEADSHTEEADSHTTEADSHTKEADSHTEGGTWWCRWGWERRRGSGHHLYRGCKCTWTARAKRTA
jgi:cytoskeletal protein RodZ